MVTRHTKYADALSSPQKDAFRLILFSPTLMQHVCCDGPDFYSCVDLIANSKKELKANDFQEIIDGTKYHKFALDLDYDVDEEAGVNCSESFRWFREAVGDIVGAVIDVFFEMFSETITRNDILICESLDKREPHRLSAHIIVQRAIPHFTIARAIADRVIALVSDEIRELIDRSLYAKKHNLRIVGCAKEGSVRVKKSLREDMSLADTFVCAPCQQINEEAAEKWIEEAGATSAHARVVEVTDVPAHCIARACELIGAKYGNSQKLRGVSGSLIMFSRVKPSFCDQCGRMHDHDNTVYVRVSKGTHASSYTLVECCRRKEGKEGIVIENVNSEDERIKGIIANACASASASEQPRARDRYCSIEKQTYSEPAMREYPQFDRTLFVRAPMKLGKTKALVKYVQKYAQDEGKHIVFVSFRRTFSSTARVAFPDFVMYSDVQGQLDYDKMIVQVESLHRIVPDKLGTVDLLILDESESILDQFDSSLSLEHARDFAVFQWLVGYAKQVIAMDAFMTERTFAVIGKMRGIEGALIVANEYQNASEDKYFFAANREEWLFALLECVRLKERVVICVNSANEGRTLYEYLTRTFCSDDTRETALKIKFYCAETSSSVKSRDFANVDECWTVCDVLIYTPTLTAGVSFERKHFDRMFGYFTDRSCSAQVCIQMMGRIRNIGKKQAFICLQTSLGSFPETREELVIALRLRKHAIMSDEMPDFAFNEEGIPVLPDSDYTELKIQNLIARNRSRNDFASEIVQLVSEAGAKCIHLTRDVLKSLFGRFPSAKELWSLAGEHKDACEEVNDRRFRAIAEAREIGPDEYKKICERQNAAAQSYGESCEVDAPSEDDLAAMRKFELRKTYDFGDELTLNHVAIFSDPAMIDIFRNLSAIHSEFKKKEGDMSAALEEMRSVEQQHLQSVMRDYERHDHDDKSGEDKDKDEDEKSRESIPPDIREMQYPYTYEPHRLAHFVVQCFGFAHVFDCVSIPARTAEEKIQALLPTIERFMPSIKMHFNIALPRRVPFDMNLFVATAGIMLRDMYGITLVNMTESFRLVQNRSFIFCDDGRIKI